MNIKKYPLSIDGDTFKELKSDFDNVLGRLITEMTKRDSEEAKMTVSIAVKLTPGLARDYKANGYDGTRDITMPKFEHNIKSVMQVKNERSGSCGGNYELAYDKETNKWVMKEIFNGQTSMFDDGEEDDPNIAQYPETVDADYTALPAPELASLPAPDVDDEDEDDFDYDPPEE